MKKKDTTENEFFAHIKQSLESYEEAYIPGSWEKFLQYGFFLNKIFRNCVKFRTV